MRCAIRTCCTRACGGWGCAGGERPPAPCGPGRLNIKADHRKVRIAEDGRGGLAAVVASANPHDGESAWSNAAARVSGAALASLLASELAVARFSGWRARADSYSPAPAAASRPG